MKPLVNFRLMARLRQSLLAPAIAELDANKPLWSLHRERQSFPGSAHHDTEVIFLRGPEHFTKESYFSIPSFDFEDEIQALPLLWDLACTMFKILQGKELGRVLIVRLKPLGEIDEHQDQGDYADYFQRAHLCLTADAHDYLACGDESIAMLPGELWWFNHHLTHFGENFSTDLSRIHMILDYRL